MFNDNVTTAQQTAINKIVNRHLAARKRSNKETAFQDCERKGMDAVRKYCRQNEIATLGMHMVTANDTLCG